MQRTPLEELVLQLRLLELGDHPGDFLRRAPEPPALEASTAFATPYIACYGRTFWNNKVMFKMRPPALENLKLDQTKLVL